MKVDKLKNQLMEFKILKKDQSQEKLEPMLGQVDKQLEISLKLKFFRMEQEAFLIKHKNQASQ